MRLAHSSSMHGPRGKSVNFGDDIFLNCTKNTELTPAHFARTVTFASHKKAAGSKSRTTKRTAVTSQVQQQKVSGHTAMKSPEWKTYRTRFLVKAKQLTSTLSFTDHLGRQHCGRRGDYLVESFDGVLSIAPRQIFEDIYVSMFASEISSPESSQNENTTQPALQSGLQEKDALNLRELRVEALKIAAVRSRIHPKAGYPLQPESNGSARVRRKSPQPVRETPPRISLM